MFRKSVDGVVAALNKAVSDLQTVADQHRTDAITMDLAVWRLRNEHAAAIEEANRADRIAARLSELGS